MAAAHSFAQVTFERLANAAKNRRTGLPTPATTPAALQRTRSSQHNQCEQADREVGLSDRSHGKIETTPLVVDGILYATAQDDEPSPSMPHRAAHLDVSAATSGDIRPCCGRVNRGVAILGNKVFLGTLDATSSRSTARL